MAARARQSARFVNVKDGQGAELTTNADMGPTQVRDHCPVDETGRHTEGARRGHAAACGRAMNLSARAYHRVLKLARTIADLAGSERTPALACFATRSAGASVQPAHIAEAIQYRPRTWRGLAGWRPGRAAIPPEMPYLHRRF